MGLISWQFVWQATLSLRKSFIILFSRQCKLLVGWVILQTEGSPRSINQYFSGWLAKQCIYVFPYMSRQLWGGEKEGEYLGQGHCTYFDTMMSPLTNEGRVFGEGELLSNANGVTARHSPLLQAAQHGAEGRVWQAWMTSHLWLLDYKRPCLQQARQSTQVFLRFWQHTIRWLS